MNAIEIRATSPASPIASELMQALDAELLQRDPQRHPDGIDLTTFEAAGGVFAVVYFEGKAVGCGSFRPVDKDMAEIKQLFVQPQFRRRGLSQKLLHWLEEIAQLRSFSRLRLETETEQRAVIHLCRSAGYIELPPASAHLDSSIGIGFEKELSGQSLRSWQGSLALEFERQADKTILRRSQVQAPLKVQRPFYPEGEAICHSVMLHTAGGIVGGDRLSFKVQLESNAQALLTTAAATKVYRSNGLEAQQSTRIQIASGACLEWLPQEAIVFDGARFRQQTKVELAAGATWLGWDIIRLGRSARGERFLSGEWRSRTEVWQAGRLIWIDPQFVQGGGEMLEHLHGLAGFPVIGSLVLIGQTISDQMLEKLRSIKPINPLQQGITRLPAGMLCRYRGESTAEARHWFIAIWLLLRQEYLSRSSCVPRVWQL